MFEARRAGEEGPRVHRILEETHFTNIHRELDTGTRCYPTSTSTRCSATSTCHSWVYLDYPHLARYLRYHLRGRSVQEKVFAIVLYRAVNRVETFEAFRRHGHPAIPFTRSPAPQGSPACCPAL